MKISLNWLKEYVNVPSDLKPFCDRLDLTGTGVEGIEEKGCIYKNVVTAKVVSKTPHPDSDHMFVCMVDVGDYNKDDDGNPAPLQIVCGAQNFNAGDHIVTALIGAELPGDIKIKKSKLRGVVSYGMNCSSKELGLGEDHSGILILPQDSPVGITLDEYLNKKDIILDLEITPNRPDCLSVVGLAREIGAIYGENWNNPLLEDAKNMKPKKAAKNLEDYVSVTIEDGKRCPRYTARLIKGVKIGPSPKWLVEKLESIGQRSINNVVDVTNYILFLYGQPLHAFDFDKIKNGEGKAEIVVRAAKDDSKFTTLDGQTRILNKDMTVIGLADGLDIALAGVMGGANSEVTDSTTSILLESATFDPGRTSRTSRNLGLFSESSMRYERRVDDHGCDLRSAAACALIVEVAGGEVVASCNGADAIIDVWEQRSCPAELKFRIKRFCNFIGADISEKFIVDTLERLGCNVKKSDSDASLAVIAPTYRPDLEREVDLYEEVLRIWGMDRIKATLPKSPKRVGKRTEMSAIKNKINDALSASGLSETMTYSFAGSHDMEMLGFGNAKNCNFVKLVNPLSSDQSVMRQYIFPSLLRSLSYNEARNAGNVKLYEIGSVFISSEEYEKPNEYIHVAGVLAGAYPQAWNSSSRNLDFYDAKGAVENMLSSLNVRKIKFKRPDASKYPFLHPGRCAEIYSASTLLGFIGELNPFVYDEFGLGAATAIFEMDVNLIKNSILKNTELTEISPYPSIVIDQNFVVDDGITNEKIMQICTSAGGRLLEDVRLFDIYRDAQKIGEGKKSMGYSFTYRDVNKTLTQEEAKKVHDKVVNKVNVAVGGETRF